MENKATIYKGEVMHDLKALFDNAGDYFEDEYELVKQYIEQLEQALDKATIAFPELLIKLMRIFYDSFINYNMELIIIPKNNTYFRVDNIKTELDIKRKVLEYCSRSALKAMPYSSERSNKKFRAKVLDRINRFLETNFDGDDIELIYVKLGNGINSSLAEEFIKSGYDMEILKDEKDNYFIHGYVKDKPSYKHFIEEYSEPEFEKLLKEIDLDKYIELGFNDFENA